MKPKLLFIALLIGIVSCDTNQKETLDLNSKNEAVTQDTSKGYTMLKQKCYICHFEKPDPSKRDEMLAPPMLRVKEHYQPVYPNKEEFINAIMAIVANPSKENTLMPGAIKKFNLMPTLVYDDAELRLIAEAIYNHDFGSFGKGNGKGKGRGKSKGNGNEMLGSQMLNNGDKWVLNEESMEQINTITKKINNFKSTNISDYNKLGKVIFDEAKIIILDESYTGELFDQIHVFFNGIEENMHTLMSTKSIDEADEQLVKLKNKFIEFHNYFE